ncbi:MAG TPA: CDP-archaeol synthase [Vicinamibacterales bacterium]|jgi:CDP-2,3-bis-(O-geranylgeranyl)-sn-glycerol synthase
MTGAPLNPFACAAFLIAAFTLAGVCHTAWLAAPSSRRFAVPLDGGRMLGGHRLFGDNKTIRGFLVMVPATGLAFGLLSSVLTAFPSGLTGLWALTPPEYALLGAWGAFGFMAGELPNSFVKRQLGISPGEAPHGRVSGPVFFVIDRIDSIAGLMLALMVPVEVPLGTWICVILVGPALHGLFSLALFRLGVKARAA